MHAVDGSRDLLLVDDTYFVQLDPARQVGEDIAVAFLGRRGVSGLTALVGSVEMQQDGRWRASVASEPSHGLLGFRRVALNRENRFDAIVALWHARRDAYVGSLAS